MIAISREELAWAAGFFDGEGNTCVINRGRGGQRIAIQISSTYKPTLERFLSAVHQGRIYGPYKRGDYKEQWVYRVNGWPTCQAVIAMLWPFLSGDKRSQAADKLSHCVKSSLRLYGIVPPHATANRYQHHRCRCDACCAAKSAARGIAPESRRGPYRSRHRPAPQGVSA